MPDAKFALGIAFQQMFADPVLLVGMFLPFVFVGVLLFYRLRVGRRLTAIANRNAQALDDNAARWQESSARSDRMIALLTEIRDHMARMAPAAPDAQPPVTE